MLNRLTAPALLAGGLALAPLFAAHPAAASQPVCAATASAPTTGCIPWNTTPPGASHGPGFSCKIVNGVPTVTLWNPTTRPLQGVVNGVTKTAPAGGKATWTVQAGVDVIVQLGAHGPKVKCPCAPAVPTTPPVTTTPRSTVPVTTVPATTAPGSTAPGTTIPGVPTTPAGPATSTPGGGGSLPATGFPTAQVAAGALLLMALGAVLAAQGRKATV